MTLKHTNQRRYIIARRCIVVVVVLIFALISYLLICRIIRFANLKIFVKFIEKMQLLHMIIILGGLIRVR